MPWTRPTIGQGATGGNCSPAGLWRARMYRTSCSLRWQVPVSKHGIAPTHSATLAAARRPLRCGVAVGGGLGYSPSVGRGWHTLGVLWCLLTFQFMGWVCSFFNVLRTTFATKCTLGWTAMCCTCVVLLRGPREAALQVLRRCTVPCGRHRGKAPTALPVRLSGVAVLYQKSKSDCPHLNV